MFTAHDHTKAAGSVNLGFVAYNTNVNGEENVATLKLGKSDNYGEGTVTLPAGTTKVTYYAVAWKDNPSKLEFSVGGTAYLKEHVVAAKSATVTEFLAESKGTWCKVTGTIANLVNETYGNFDLVGEDGASVYVYGLTKSYVIKNDKSFASLGLKEGDVITLVGKRDSYNDKDQVGGPAYFISKVEAAE